MTPTTYGRDFAYCLKSHGGVRGFYASLWRFLLRCTLFCHSVATFLTSVSSYEGGCGFEEYYNSLDFGKYSGLALHVFDESFVQTMKMFWIDKTNDLFGQTPKALLLIEHAKLCFYQFPSPMYNKSQAKEWRNKEPRSIPGINLYSIAKEVNGDNIVFYDGWNPQKRGEKIMKEFFVKTL